MAQLYEYSLEDVHGVLWYGGASVGNSFTIGTVGPNEDFYIRDISVELGKQGTPPEPLYFSLYKAGVDGKPVGNVLSSGTLYNVIAGTFSWYNVSMSRYKLENSEKYIFLIRAVGGDGSNRYIIKFGENPYAGGEMVIYDGVDYILYPEYDNAFKIWGEPVIEGLYEYFNTPNPETTSHIIIGRPTAETWHTQSITIGLTGPNENFNITSVKFNLGRYGNPGMLVVSIRNSDAEGKPIGEDLSVGTLDGNIVTTDRINLQWYQINMSPYTLEAGKTYSLVFRCPEGKAWNWLCIEEDDWSYGYNNGITWYLSSDSGATWSEVAVPEPEALDFVFEIWGEPIIEEGFLDITGVTAPGAAHTGDLINFVVHTKNTDATDDFKVELSGDLTDSQEFSLGAGLTKDVPFSFTMPDADVSITINTYHLTGEGFAQTGSYFIKVKNGKL